MALWERRHTSGDRVSRTGALCAVCCVLCAVCEQGRGGLTIGEKRIQYGIVFMSAPITTGGPPSTPPLRPAARGPKCRDASSLRVASIASICAVRVSSMASFSIQRPTLGK